MDIVGKQIGRYEITEKIGEGAMAEVYEVYDPEINRTLALKILKDEHLVDEEHYSRFLREGQAAGALTHPNIVTVHDVGRLDGAPYILMELLRGKTLGDAFRAGETFSPESVIQIGLRLASALDYAHEQGVIHRDIKPDNIILDENAESVRIADFGIARMEEASNQESTQVGMMLGTPRYMSPEQAEGAPVDGRSDLFTLGVILYEMSTGQKAFDAESLPTLIMQIVQRDPVPIRQINQDVPVGLQKIISKLLQKKPAKRYQNGRELCDALERELHALKDVEQERLNYMPLQIKWTAIMSAVVALTLALSSALVFRAQKDMLTQQAVDSGLLLGQFIAVQAAIPVLAEDWISLESFVKDASSRRSFSYLVVTDHQGVVRSASDTRLVGEPWSPPETGKLLFEQEDAKVVALNRGDDEIFNFDLPVLFNETRVGGVTLGLDTTQLESALSTTQRMMSILGMAVVLAVSVVIYLFNKLTARNLLTATRAIQLFGRGRLDTRISKERRDEFGELFLAYNGMADSLEGRLESVEIDQGSEEAGHELDVSGIRQTPVDDKTVVGGSKDHTPS